jgi:hypothetical protein
MPRSPEWFLRLPEIIDELKQLEVPVVGRAIFESVFEVGRRRAIQLMHRFGGYQVGRTFIVDRGKLIAELERNQADESFGREERRKAKLTQALEEARRLNPGRKVRIASSPTVHDQLVADLPVGVHLKPGELRIEFFGTEDLLRHLYELSQAILNDYGRFQSLIESDER